jgi:uncharacterized membrane protein
MIPGNKTNPVASISLVTSVVAMLAAISTMCSSRHRQLTIHHQQVGYEHDGLAKNLRSYSIVQIKGIMIYKIEQFVRLELMSFSRSVGAVFTTRASTIVGTIDSLLPVLYFLNYLAKILQYNDCGFLEIEHVV